MRLIGLLLGIYVITLGVNARSQDIADLPSDVTYEQTIESLKAPYPTVLDRHFANLNFEVLEGRNDISPLGALAWMNKIYVTKNYGNDDDRIVFAKSGVEIKGSFEFNKIYRHPKGYIVHYKVDGSTLVLFFRDFPRESIKVYNSEIVRDLKLYPEKNMAGIQRQWSIPFQLREIFYSTAFAETAGSSASCNLTLNGETPKTDASALKQMWGCTKGFGGGVWDATGGAVWSVAKGAYTLVAHPVDTFNKVSDGFNSIVAAMKDFEGAFGQLKSAFLGLPNDVKWNIGCEVFSSLGTSVAIAFLTAGAGSPILLRAMAQALLKVANALPKSAITAKLLAMAGEIGKKAVDAQTKVDQIRGIPAYRKVLKIHDEYLAKLKGLDIVTKQLSVATRSEANMVMARGKPFPTESQVIKQLTEQKSNLENELKVLAVKFVEANRAAPEIPDAVDALHPKYVDSLARDKKIREVGVGAYFASAGCATLRSVDKPIQPSESTR